MTTQEDLNKRILEAAAKENVGTLQDCITNGADVNCKNSDGQALLHIAVEKDNADIVHLLLQKEAYLSIVNKESQTPLHLAAWKGNPKVVNLLLKDDAGLRKQNNVGQTPLHLAAKYALKEVVTLLLKSKDALSITDDMGQTPLHIATRESKKDVVDLLITKGASLTVVTKKGQTPLHLAARDARTDVVDFLLQKGALPSEKDNEVETPLHIAAVRGNAEIVELLINAKALLGVRNSKGQTPLHHAAGCNNPEVIYLLLKENNASLDKKDCKGQTPLHIAACGTNSTVVDHLINNNASLSAENNDNQTPLHNAASEGSSGVVDILLKAGATTYVKNESGQTPLHLAAMRGIEKIVELLINSKALLDEVNSKKQTPLHLAVGHEHTNIVRLLLEGKAHLDKKDIEDQTPLHIAVVKGNAEIVDLLITGKALLDEVNSKYQTPLHLAAVIDNAKIVDLLINANALLDEVNSKKQTPLHLAVEHEHTNIVRLLLEGKAHLDKKDIEDQKPLHIAAVKGNAEIVDLLITGKALLDEVNSKNQTPLHIAEEKCKKDVVELLTKKGSSQTVVNSAENKMYKGMASKTDEIVDEMNQLSLGNCVYLGGVSKVGKSSLASILIGEKISQHWKSTDGLNTYFGRIGIDWYKKEMVPLKQATIQEDIKQEIKQGTYKIEITPLDLVDFGGQMSFDMPHQLFMRQKGTFVLMFDGRIDFSVSLAEYEQGETTESILKHWVTSILSYCEDDEDNLSMIMFSATHSDDFKEENRKKRKKQLIQDLGEIFKNHKRQHRIIYDDIFFINGKDKNDLEINKLKSKLVEVAFKQNSCGKRMPMAWVPLDLQLSELRLHNMNIISEEELITLNRRNGDLALTDKHIRYFLNGQHSLGKILYFDQHGLDHFIILQPQSLVNILSSFITAPNFWPMDEELKGILCTNTVQIAKQDLLKLWSQKKFHQYMPNDDFKEFIILVLVHLAILVEIKHYRQEQVQSYLVPCRVKHRLPVTGCYVKSADKMICLSYTLLKSSIPAALFFKLIGAAINAWSLKETPEGICLYHQAAILCIDESNELHLLVEDDKVFVYLINRDTKRFISPNIASMVQEYITSTMQKVLSLSTSEVPKAFEMEVGEWCTSEGGCYISVTTVKDGGTWICKNNKEHNTKYPLYWISDKKQVNCDEMCPGLDKIQLALCPKYKHLFKLASRITLEECRYVVNNLGLSITTCDFILDLDRYDYTVRIMLALWKCNELRHKQCLTLSFKELYDALPASCTIHVLCQLFMEDVTFHELANIALQEIPEEIALYQLSKNVGNCAMHLGVELELVMPAIEKILFKDRNNMFIQTFGVMKKWKSSSKVKPTIFMLMKAFQSVDPRGLYFLTEKYSFQR